MADATALGAMVDAPDAGACQPGASRSSALQSSAPQVAAASQAVDPWVRSGMRQKGQAPPKVVV